MHAVARGLRREEWAREELAWGTWWLVPEQEIWHSQCVGQRVSLVCIGVVLPAGAAVLEAILYAG